MSAHNLQEYALGTHDAEIVRLGVQHKLWSSSRDYCREAMKYGKVLRLRFHQQRWREFT